MSQRKLAMEFQLIGCDIDRNVITRIESNQRYVTDIELCAIMKVFGVESSYLLEDQEDHGRIEGSRTEGRRAEGSQTEGGRAEEGRDRRRPEGTIEGFGRGQSNMRGAGIRS